MRIRTTLAGQLLLLQLLIVLVVLVAVAAISLAESAQEIRRVEGREALSAAQSLSVQQIVRSRIKTARSGRDPALAAAAETTRSVSGSSLVAVALPDRTVLASSDPTLVGRPLPLGDSDVLSGRAWTGLVEDGGRASVVAHVPVQDARTGEMTGIVAIGRDYPSAWERLAQSTPNLLTYLGVATVLGVAGSLLLSRRVKRQTRGLEPSEIARLVEQREAMLHGIKEGVVGVDREQRVTLANDSAIELLGLPADCPGRTLDELGLEPHVRDVLTGRQASPDRLVLAGDRLLACNRMPMRLHGRVIGSVTTLRDRTELASLEQELGATRATSDTLRAQTHEFANQLHTISGLLQLEEYDEVLRFVDGVSQHRASLYDEVTSRVSDPTLAALLIAKASLATERGVELRLLPESSVARLDETLSRDVTTVVGNLVDNAIDAVVARPQGRVEVRVRDEEDAVEVEVRDNGPGVPEADRSRVFEQGFSTKAGAGHGGRGFGLAITRLVCRRRGGDVWVRDEDGAVFTARLPRTAARP